jgi:hypothetical protein
MSGHYYCQLVTGTIVLITSCLDDTRETLNNGPFGRNTAKKKLMQWQASVWLVDGGWHVDLHLILRMIGFHDAVKLSQNETFHCRNHMNMIILIYEWERRKQTTLLRDYRGGLLRCGSNAVCVCLSASL